MDNINQYIQRIQNLANRNKELNARLQNLVGRYSLIQKQNEKYNELLARFSDISGPVASDFPEKKTQKKVEHLKTVSLLYISICGFEDLAKMDSQSDLIDILDEIYITIDKVAEDFKLTKIKSFGDNIIYAAGLSNEYRTNPIDITMASIRMHRAILNIYQQQKSQPFWKVKMGIHTGPVLSVDPGKQYTPYSISGDNVNVVCRIGESCPPGQINMSEMTYELVKEFFNVSHLGSIPVKYKGAMNMYLVNGLTDDLHVADNVFENNETFDVRYGQIQFMDIQENILDLLEKNLPSNLYYHNVKHTVDVITEVELIGWAEGLSEEEILILKIAALFHDAGHIVDYRYHEHQGVLMARQILPRYNIPQSRIDTICRLILATKLPPQPKDKLEEVMCDSDLDYLGRTDFIPVSNMLYRELKERQMVDSWQEWNQMQLDFIKQHQYFTKTAQNLREVNKQQQIERLRQLLNENEVKVKY
ncbi:adenylate/guanylate cyclase domain-containing protein [Anaerophaga thermohalophila]|uniref:adenylate/guanylate cyclase domain-containing protein n=1 Tax=Anaerophaga thermohalophila TaxID=177400 RepID=UPI000237C4F4|nr:adenylate/guanylate cyclase domain-containing protein [Anaerophaga thermohalophila]MDI3521747.1 adenylate cyclase [Anaerophaga sp.]